MTGIVVRIEPGGFDAAVETDRLRALPGVGAIVTFTGVCRDEGGRLAALEIEHYSGMAEAEIRRIAKEAAERWPVGAMTIIHRYGRIAVGDEIVLVATASEHREAAFAAAGYVMDFLKTSAPFWKREIAVDGSAGEWVDARDTDDTATKRWR